MNGSHHFKIMGEEEAMTLLDAQVSATNVGYEEVILDTSRGAVQCRYRPGRHPGKAVLMVGGVGGGFDSPADDLYSKLTEELPIRDVAALRVRFRHPSDLTEAALDVLAGLDFLRDNGTRMTALIGHSLGAAAVIQAAAHDPSVKVVVGLSTQSYGADAAAFFRDGVASLFIHGGNDSVMPSRCSSYAYSLAKEPKELIVHDHTGHSLDEASGEVYNEVLSWIMANLK